MESIVIKPSDGTQVDLTTLSKKQLYWLHHDEELYMAEKLKKMKPFSYERAAYLDMGYSFVTLVKQYYFRKEGNMVAANGATKQTVDYVDRSICRYFRKNRRKIFLFEAGTGEGYSMGKLAKRKFVRYVGCDVYKSERAMSISRNFSNVKLVKGTLAYVIKKVKDSSVDVFYADNVLEHLMEDEVSVILSDLYKKIRRGGEIIAFMPNKYVGPTDISYMTLKMGERSAGFHFMEVSYAEWIKLFKNAGFKPCAVSVVTKNNCIIEIPDWFGILNIIKCTMEPLLGKIKDEKLRKKIFYRLGYGIYKLNKTRI